MKFIVTPSYIDDGLINTQVSADGLRLYNYSHKCQYAKAWDEITMQARGIVVDKDDNVVAFPFKKFFNLEEFPEKVPAWPPETVTEKVDGSAIIAFVYNGELRLNTRGSFNSDQAIKAREIMKGRYKQCSIDMLKSFKDHTHIFEVIYKENKIVVDYGDKEELVYLGSIVTDTGEDVGLIPALKETFPCVMEHDSASLEKLMGQDQTNREGFVLRWKDGFRVKAKFAEYVRLHRLLTGINEKSIWAELRAGRPLDSFMEAVPEEFLRFVKETEEGLHNTFAEIEKQAKMEYGECHAELLAENADLEDEKDYRKRFASFARNKTHPAILFQMFDDRSYADNIWKLIEPKYIKSFKEEV